MEVSEETLMYVVPTVLGQHVARKAFSKGLPENLKKEVATVGAELIEKNGANNKKVLPVKAAIALAAMADSANRIFFELYKKFDDAENF